MLITSFPIPIIPLLNIPPLWPVNVLAFFAAKLLICNYNIYYIIWYTVKSDEPVKMTLLLEKKWIVLIELKWCSLKTSGGFIDFGFEINSVPSPSPHDICSLSDDTVIEEIYILLVYIL